MACAQATIEVDVPLHAAYDAWADIRRHTGFVRGVERVEALDEVTWRLHGRSLGGSRSWALRVAQASQDEHITMHSLDGPWDAMVVLFERVTAERTAVTLLRDHEPEGGPEPDLQPLVAADLDRYKRHVETEARVTLPMVATR